MKVSEIKFAKKFNEGNYESEEYAITAIVDEDETAADVFAILKKEVTAAHSGETTGEKKNEVDEDRPARGRGKGKSKDTEDDDSEEEEIEGEEETDDSQEEVEDEGNEESEEESEDDSTSKKPAKKSSSSTDGTKGGKKFKKKPQVYQRTNEAHKKIFGDVLREVAPNWKSSDKSKAKGKSVSTKMEGEEFLDEDGDVLASFKQDVKKHMAAKK